MDDTIKSQQIVEKKEILETKVLNDVSASGEVKMKQTPKTAVNKIEQSKKASPKESEVKLTVTPKEIPTHSGIMLSLYSLLKKHDHINESGLLQNVETKAKNVLEIMTQLEEEKSVAPPGRDRRSITSKLPTSKRSPEKLTQRQIWKAASK